MAEGLTTPPITQLEMSEADIRTADKIAARVGYKQTAYTSTSGLWGLFCMRENPEYAKPGEKSDHNGVIIKTKEFGFLLIHDTEDLHLGNWYGMPKQRKGAK